VHSMGEQIGQQKPVGKVVRGHHDHPEAQSMSYFGHRHPASRTHHHSACAVGKELNNNNVHITSNFDVAHWQTSLDA
jgi:hypothetical protein